jgi:N4-gp56 family major capsid protein
MADAMTTTASVGLDQTAYDRLAYFALRPELYFDAVADVQPTRQSMPGAAVVFTIISDLAVASTALNESVDVDAVALADSNVTVTLVEYGNAVNTTMKLRATSFIEVNPVVANVLGFNAGRSIDSVAQGVVQAGTNVAYATGGTTDPTARNTVEPEDTLTARDVRRTLAQLRGANVAPNKGNLYTAFIHPDVSFDLRGETGAAAWRDPHTYSQPEEIWSGEIGAFEGFRFIETPRAPVFADAGSSTTLTDVYATIFTGKQAIAKAYSTTEGNGAMPRVIMSPVVDKMRRFVPLAWYHLVGYSRFREASLRRVESSSSIGTNA